MGIEWESQSVPACFMKIHGSPIVTSHGSENIQKTIEKKRRK